MKMKIKNALCGLMSGLLLLAGGMSAAHAAVNVTTLAGSGPQGFADGPSTSATFRIPAGVAVDAIGNVYVADQSNHRIRKITPAGFVTTLAGSAPQGFQDGSVASARFSNPSGVAVDANGNVYVAD